MRKFEILILALLCAVVPQVTPAADYVFIDAFERILCDGSDCAYCSPVDPLPLCGTHSHCLPREDGSSMCTYPAGGGTQGATCSEQADCAGAFLCAQTQTLACRQWCALPNGSCPGGTTCTGFLTPLSTGSQEWGVCL